MRPPWTIWLYAMVSMWRLLLLTTGVLVCVLAFAAAVKPLADGKLGALDTLKYMLLAMPPMLQYALPFSAGFAATLAYHRMAADNEVSACHAGGVGHRVLLVPAAVTGLVLGGSVLWMSNQIMPVYLRKMADIISLDVGRLLSKSIERGQAERFGDVVIQADVCSAPKEDESGKTRQLTLYGLLAMKLDDDGRPRVQVSARTATVWMTRVGAGEGEHGGDGRESYTRLVIRPEDYSVWTPEGRSEGEKVVIVKEIENKFKDDPKFLTWGELLELRHAPERMNWIDTRRARLALALAQRDTIDTVRDSLRRAGSVEFVDEGGRVYVLRGADLRLARRDAGWEAMGALEGSDQDNNGIYLERTTEDGRRQVFRAEGAWLDFPEIKGMDAWRSSGLGGLGDEPARVGQDGEDGEGGGVQVQITLFNLRLDDNGGRGGSGGGGGSSRSERLGAGSGVAAGEVSQRAFGGLVLSRAGGGGGGAAVVGGSTAQVLAGAEAFLDRRPEDGPIKRLESDLLDKLADLSREIMSKQHERIATSMACMVMIVTGGVLALRKRESLPLMVYLWSFFPALISVLTISAGQQLTHESGWIGLPLLWGGVIGLAGFTGWEYTKLARH